jgi:hypothetical protein
VKTVIAAILLLCLAFQTGCYYKTAAGPTGPIPPGDSAAVDVLSHADRVEVTTLDGRALLLWRPWVSGPDLFGRRHSNPRSAIRTIPLDSVAQTRIHQFSVGRTILLYLGISLVGLGVVIASADCLPCSGQR